MSPRYAALIGIVLAVLVITQPSRAGDDSSLKGNVIEFLVRPKSDTGLVVCALFYRNGWLTKPVKPAWAAIKDRRAVCRFTAVPPGAYGISAYHDENKNGKLDTNVFGMPVEDYCASRDARGTFSAPRFDDAKFDYHGGRLQLSAELK